MLFSSEVEYLSLLVPKRRPNTSPAIPPIPSETPTFVFPNAISEDEFTFTFFAEINPSVSDKIWALTKLSESKKFTFAPANPAPPYTATIVFDDCILSLAKTVTSSVKNICLFLTSIVAVVVESSSLTRVSTKRPAPTIPADTPTFLFVITLSE